MARVQSIDLAGVEAFWNPGDHDPPHFHAKKAEHWHVKVHFMENRDRMIEVRRENKKLTGNARRALCEAVEAAREALLEEWERMHPEPERGLR